MSINAFDPAYVSTYMPEFLTKIRVESNQYAHGVINGGKSRVTRESKSGKYVNSISAFPKTQAKGK
jgi:hypothetical protein